jgi:amidase
MTATADAQLAFAGPGTLAELVRRREVSPRELVELCVRRIEALDLRVNAFRATMPERALATADGPLDRSALLAGVPFAVKDEMPVAGQPLTMGSRSYGPARSTDAEIVRRLRAAGAIPIGITNVPELMIFPWTASDANGITRNPWHLQRTPGGSSGGSAAAVAAGMVPFATAADGGGSIRIPASCCGLVGMKPTRGRVSMYPVERSLLGLAVYGALARSVRDSGLVLDVLRGPAPGEAELLPPPATSFREAAQTEPGRLRIAVSRRLPPGVIARLSTDQRSAWERTGRLLEALGHEVIERDPDYGPMGAIQFTESWLRGIYEASLEVPDRSQLERSSRQMAALGRIIVPPRRRERVIAARAVTSRRTQALWDEVDVLLTPALASTAIAAEGGHGRGAAVALDRAARFTPWTAAFNLTGQPAVSVPAGFSADGLPLSVQLVGRFGAEDVLYSLAAQIETAEPWAGHHPPLG